MVSLQCNNCVIHTWALQRRASHNGVLCKSSFLYFFLFTFRFHLVLVSRAILVSVSVIVNENNATLVEALRHRCFHRRPVVPRQGYVANVHSAPPSDFTTLRGLGMHACTQFLTLTETPPPSSRRTSSWRTVQNKNIRSLLIHRWRPSDE